MNRSYRKHHPYKNHTKNDSYKESQTNNYINNNDTKRELINKLSRMVDMSKFRYKMLQSIDDLDMLKKNTYRVSQNQDGINCAMVFMKIRSGYYSFTTDRRSLGMPKDKIDISKIKVYPFEVRLDRDVYNGTIFDGVLLRKQDEHGNKTYVINDVYYLHGQNLCHDRIDNKILNAKIYLNANLTKDLYFNRINITVGDIHPITKLRSLYNNSDSTSMRGFTFYPEYSGLKLIFLLPKEDQTDSKKSESTEVQDNKVQKQKVRDTSYSSIKFVFEMRKTETPDGAS